MDRRFRIYVGVPLAALGLLAAVASGMGATVSASASTHSDRVVSAGSSHKPTPINKNTTNGNKPFKNW